MIHHKPVCFHCEKPIDYDPIFSPPLCDHDDCGSAAFHGICLMEWRERREEVWKRVSEAKQAFLRYLNGECSCEPQE